MKAAGFAVTVTEVEDTSVARKRSRLPDKFGSCHTAVVAGYVVEGHVPADDVKRTAGLLIAQLNSRLNMKLFTLIFTAALSLTSNAFAQASAAEHSAHHAPSASAAAAPTSDGEVRKVDKELRKVTLKHGPIANLDMPGMTMVFKVADPKLLDSIKQGDKVKFSAENINGALTVTAIEVAK